MISSDGDRSRTGPAFRFQRDPIPWGFIPEPIPDCTDCGRAMRWVRAAEEFGCGCQCSAFNGEGRCPSCKRHCAGMGVLA